jgi:hypothetical protein
MSTYGFSWICENNTAPCVPIESDIGYNTFEECESNCPIQYYKCDNGTPIPTFEVTQYTDSNCNGECEGNYLCNASNVCVEDLALNGTGLSLAECSSTCVAYTGDCMTYKTQIACMSWYGYDCSDTNVQLGGNLTTPKSCGTGLSIRRYDNIDENVCPDESNCLWNCCVEIDWNTYTCLNNIYYQYAGCENCDSPVTFDSGCGTCRPDPTATKIEYIGEIGSYYGMGNGYFIGPYTESGWKCSNITTKAAVISTLDAISVPLTKTIYGYNCELVSTVKTIWSGDHGGATFGNSVTTNPYTYRGLLTAYYKPIESDVQEVWSAVPGGRSSVGSLSVPYDGYSNGCSTIYVVIPGYSGGYNINAVTNEQCLASTCHYENAYGNSNFPANESGCRWRDPDLYCAMNPACESVGNEIIYDRAPLGNKKYKIGEIKDFISAKPIPGNINSGLISVSTTSHNANWAYQHTSGYVAGNNPGNGPWSCDGGQTWGNDGSCNECAGQHWSCAWFISDLYQLINLDYREGGYSILPFGGNPAAELQTDCSAACASQNYYSGQYAGMQFTTGNDRAYSRTDFCLCEEYKCRFGSSGLIGCPEFTSPGGSYRSFDATCPGFADLPGATTGTCEHPNDCVAKAYSNYQASDWSNLVIKWDCNSNSLKDVYTYTAAVIPSRQGSNPYYTEYQCSFTCNETSDICEPSWTSQAPSDSSMSKTDCSTNCVGDFEYTGTIITLNY